MRRQYPLLRHGDLYIVDLDYAHVGVIVKDGRIIDAPPILAWSIGKQIKSVVHHAKRHGGLVTRYKGEKDSSIPVVVW